MERAKPQMWEENKQTGKFEGAVSCGDNKERKKPREERMHERRLAKGGEKSG